jgi:hypothetical protein
MSHAEVEQIQFPIALGFFWEDLEREDSSLFMEHHTFCSRINPKRSWNIIGREKLEIQKWEAFSMRLTDEISRIKACPIIAGHYGMSRAWMPPHFCAASSSSNEVDHFKMLALTYLRQIMPDTFQGAVCLDSPNESGCFLKALIVYPTVFRYLNLYLFSTSVPLVIEIGHHADVTFYSSSNDCIPNKGFLGFDEHDELGFNGCMIENQ